MRTCDDCHWADYGGLLGIFDSPIGCQKQEKQEWVDSMIVPVELPCASFVTPGDMLDETKKAQARG